MRKWKNYRHGSKNSPCLTAEACGCEIWYVEYVKKAGYLIEGLSVKVGCVSLMTCGRYRERSIRSRAADPIPESFIFDVSSAGGQRELKRPWDLHGLWARSGGWSSIYNQRRREISWVAFRIRTDGYHYLRRPDGAYDKSRRSGAVRMTM